MSKRFEYVLNFGPHHPSTHGVMRLALSLFGEEVRACEPDIGYLHRGVEKIVENKRFLSIIPYIDRLDYLAPAIQEHAYVISIEKILKISVPKRALIIRTIFDELSRISSHIMAIGSLAYDLGCLSLFLYGFEEREKIMDIFERTTGRRMHISYYVPGGVFNDISDEITEMVRAFVDEIGFYIEAVEKLTLNNRIFEKRTRGIGIISSNMAMKYGISGVNLRASGISYDIRKLSSYGIYDLLEFEPITLTEGDCYARNKLRYLEMKQSLDIIRQSLNRLKPGMVFNSETFNERRKWPAFKKFDYPLFPLNGISLPKNIKIYSATESPRGEFGVHMFVEEADQFKPYRMHFKSPSFANIQILKSLLIGVKIPDINAIIGSLDFIMGCCDR
ncbi:MAG: NADH-quinone oxidoreductase subunit D [Holosporales bacterium]|jgi:NADH-quinone oxidoreductase subunit D|nr:NADH-quinone oxidoreductase subunit D [Holosporales bacterium]